MQTRSWPWDTLEVEPGADERSVRRAYARILKQRRPDADPDAFQRLRSAYEFALVLAQNAAKAQVQAAQSVQTTQAEALRADDGVAVAPPASVGACATDTTLNATIAPIATESRDAVDCDASSTITSTRAEAQTETSRHDPVQEAVRRWQEFVADPMRYRSSRDVGKLFDEAVSIQVREELEWQAVLHCLRDDTPSRLRVCLCEALEWRQNHKHLLRRDASVANAALARAFADEDYETLSRRYPTAIALLADGEAMRKRMKRMVFDAELEREMVALIASLSHYYQNVRRLRFDASLIELWQKRHSLRTRITGWLLPLAFQSLWFGMLVASASTMAGETARDWVGPWGPLQIALAFVGVMTYLLGASVASTLAPEQRAWVATLRAKVWVRYGWIALWLVAVTLSLASGPRGTAANAAVAALAVCTIWTSVAYGLLPITRLVFTSLTYAVGLGFIGHWAGVSRPLWVLAVAHGVLIVYFLHFARGPLRAMVGARPRLVVGLGMAWVMAAVAFLILLQADEQYASRYAWALFALMMPVVSGMLTDKAWSRIGDIPFPLQHLLFVVYWWTVGLVTPNLAAGFALLVTCLPVAVEMKRVWTVRRGRND